MPGTRTMWVDFLVDRQLASGAAADAVNLTSSVVESEARIARMTLLRTIIGLDLAYLVHDSGEGSQQVSLGIAVASREAFETALALSDPETASDRPTRGWVYRARYRVYGFAADQPAIFNVRIDKDLRGKRVLENGVLVMTFHNAPEEGVASAVLVSGYVRTLWSLS